MLLRLLHRINEKRPWSHNDAYTPLVLLAARGVRRAGGSSALDIGCGTGNLAARLAEHLPHVVGLEADKGTADLAAQQPLSCRQCVEHAFFPQPPVRRFNLVSIVAVLHHMPLVQGVRAAREAVAPGAAWSSWAPTARLLPTGCCLSCRSSSTPSSGWSCTRVRSVSCLRR